MSAGLSSPQPWEDQPYNAQAEADSREIELDTLVGIFKKGYYIEVHPIEREMRDPNFDAGENKIVFSIPPLETENSSFIPQVGKTFMVLRSNFLDPIELIDSMASLGAVELIRQLKKGVFRVVTLQGGQEHYFLVKVAQPRLMH